MINVFHEDGTLPEDEEYFVFGSNLSGIHGAGAALVAKTKFGAISGQGVGLYGRSIAIPTKGAMLNVLPLDMIQKYVKLFVDGTIAHPELKFFVTRVGCGLAGYKDNQIAPMFKGAINCSFAQEWKPYLEG